MSRNILWVVACLVAVAPSFAPAAITVKVEDRTLGLGIPQFVDIVFEATGANQTMDEALAFYDLGLRVRRVSGTGGGLRFVDPYATKNLNADGYIFPDSAEFVVAEATPTTILANVSANTTANFDITSGKKAGRIWFEVDPLTGPLSIFEIEFDPDLTIFASGTGDDPIIPVTLASGRIGYIPEPSGSVLLGGGALALRRRRVA